MSNQLKGILLASLTAFMWAILAIALEVILYELPPITVSWFRLSLAFIFLFIFFLIKSPKQIAIVLRPPLYAIIAAVFLGLNYIGFIVGLKLTTPVMAQLFIQIGPVLLAISGFVLFHEKLSIRQAIGLFIVIAGLYLFYHQKLIVSRELDGLKTGVLWVIFGAVCWTGYAIFQKKAVVTDNPMLLNLILFGIPAVLLLPFVSFDLLKGLSLISWLNLIFLGLNTLISYVSLAYAFKLIEANKISVIITLNPILTIFIMYVLSVLQVSWIKQEQYSIMILAGALLVLIGVILTVLKGKKPSTDK